GNTIFIKGYGLTEEIVRNQFHKFGTVTDVRFERDRFGFVTYKTSDEAEKAVNEMNGERVENVNVHVSYARRQYHNDRGDIPISSRDSPPRDHHEEPPKVNRELQKYDDDFF
ncbi:Negative elongation factor E, partial [Paramuricea clavata]